MLIDAIMVVLVGVLTGVFGLLPSFTLAGSITAFGSAAGSSLAGVNGVFPVTTLGQCLGVVLGVRVFLVAWNIIVWLYDKIPFKAT